ncbi:MAG: ATP-binding protein [Anaerolineae bacterium]
MTLAPYRSGREHLFDELKRLDLLINAQVIRQRHDPAYAEFDQFRGLFLSEEEIDALLGERAPNEPTPQADLDRIAAAVSHLEEVISRRAAAALEAGVHLPLHELGRRFQLSPFELDVILICLAPELELKYTRLYAYLQNDVTRRRPTHDLILSLLCRSLEERIDARARLSPWSPLYRYGLIAPAEGRDPWAHPGGDWLSQPIRLSDRVGSFLLGIDAPDAAVASFSRRVAPRASLDELMLSEPVIHHMRRAMTARQPLLLIGPRGIGKKHAAEALCRAHRLSLLVADARRMTADGRSPTTAMRDLCREATLTGSAIYIDHADALWHPASQSPPAADADDADHALAAEETLALAIELATGPVFVGASSAWDPPPELAARLTVVTFPMPDFAQRHELWRRFLSGNGYRPLDDADVAELADRFRFTPGTMRRAIQAASQAREAAGTDGHQIDLESLFDACRAQSSARMSALAQKITPLYSWEDIILPHDVMAHLREVCAHARFRHRVFDEWGFRGKISLGKGLSVLFVGPSGTGKTMAAEIIARELRLDLYKIDLSAVVSKYIGETEKNLRAIFDEAERSHVVLFFDEADSVFGKRSEVKDAHDRYANIEINYLLQKIEEYEGIVILASNFQKNIDEAFTRRMRFIVEFPFPEEEDRYRIWRRIFPADTPLGADIDFEFLARQLKITGGSIRNIALGAAFMAAADSGVVHMEHVIRATRREFQKMGRLCVKADFGPYYDWVSEAP